MNVVVAVDAVGVRGAEVERALEQRGLVVGQPPRQLGGERVERQRLLVPVHPPDEHALAGRDVARPDLQPEAARRAAPSG